MKTLCTARLILRPWTLEDAPDMYDYARTPNVGPAAGWKPHESIEETQQVLRELFLPHDDNFAMQRKDDGRVIGSIGLHEDQSRPKGLPVRMLGYVMNEKDWGQGFMHEGCMAALEYAFAELGVELMTVFHYPWNELLPPASSSAWASAPRACAAGGRNYDLEESRTRWPIP